MTYIYVCYNTSSSIQTILSASEFHRVSRRNYTASRGLYRRWGITPRPEDIYSVVLNLLYTLFQKMQALLAKNKCSIFELTR